MTLRLKQQLRGALVAAQWRGDTALTLPLFWRRSTVSPVFFGRYPRSCLHSFVLRPPPPLHPSLISYLASVDVKQHGPHWVVRARTSRGDIKGAVRATRVMWDSPCVQPTQSRYPSLSKRSLENYVKIGAFFKAQSLIFSVDFNLFYLLDKTSFAKAGSFK